MDKKLFRKSVKWFFILILEHFAGMIFFSLALSNLASSLSDGHRLRASIIILIFNIVFVICFSALYFKLESSYIEYQRKMKEVLRAQNFSIIRVFKQEFLKEHIVMLAIYAVLQIPFLIFYAIWGMSLTSPLIFEQFYIVDAGCYLITNTAVLGFLLNTLIFAVIFSAARLLFIFMLRKDVDS